MRRKPLFFALVCGGLGFVCAFVWSAWAISRAMNSTAAIGYLFIPFTSFVAALSSSIFGYCAYLVVEYCRNRKGNLFFRCIIPLCVSLGIAIPFACWIGQNLCLCEAVNEVRHMNLDEVRRFLESSYFKENKYVLNTVVSRRDADSEMLYRISQIDSAEL